MVNKLAFLSPDKINKKTDYIGQAIPDGKLFIIDKNSNSVTEQGQQGELCYQGENVFIGYAQNSSELAIAEQNNYLATGDIAEFDHEGDFKLVGRIKRIIKVLGKRINLDEVQQHLISFYQKDLLVTGIDDQLNIMLIKEELKQPTENISKILIEEAVKFTRLNSRYITLTYLSSFPILSNGKIDYRALNDCT